jgi:hypothetical protein
MHWWICRALADQLEGNEEEHKKYRSMVVEYILVHGFWNKLNFFPWLFLYFFSWENCSHTFFSSSILWGFPIIFSIYSFL